MNVLTTTLTTWTAAALAATAGWALIAGRRKRAASRAARQRYTAEAIAEAARRITADTDSRRWLDAHTRAVQDGRCTADCPTAFDVQFTLELGSSAPQPQSGARP